jgi:hypothetical protein
MYDGEISSNSNTFYSQNVAANGGGVYTQASGSKASASFVMHDGLIKENIVQRYNVSSDNRGGGVYALANGVDSKVNVEMKGGLISKNVAFISGGATAAVGLAPAGTAANNWNATQSVYGGGVALFAQQTGADVSFDMNGGEISENIALALANDTGNGQVYSNAFGGGVYAYASNANSKATFTLREGTITGNKASAYGRRGAANTTAFGGGAGVHTAGAVNASATFDMLDGEISDNSVEVGTYLATPGTKLGSGGGGISIRGDSGGASGSQSTPTFTMTGGEIKDNKAPGITGGGVGLFGTVNTDGQYTDIHANIESAKIEGNTAGYGGGIGTYTNTASKFDSVDIIAAVRDSEIYGNEATIANAGDAAYQGAFTEFEFAGNMHVGADRAGNGIAIHGAATTSKLISDLAENSVVNFEYIQGAEAGRVIVDKIGGSSTDNDELPMLYYQSQDLKIVIGSSSTYVLDWISDFYVDIEFGSDDNLGTQASPFRSIQKAVATGPLGTPINVFVMRDMEIGAEIAIPAGKEVMLQKDPDLPAGTDITLLRSADTRTDTSTGSATPYLGYIFKVVTGGTLTLKDLIVDGNKGNVAGATEALVAVLNGYGASTGATVLPEGTGTRINNDGSATVPATFNMDGGELTNNANRVNNGRGQGGAIFAEAYDAGAYPIYINITGGSIYNNNLETYASGTGGAIFAVGRGVVIDMSGGSIHDNTTLLATANQRGGGVYLNQATLILSGDAEISSNSSYNGGGIYMYGANTKVTMSGGLISGNSSVREGGGIYIPNDNAANTNPYTPGAMQGSLKITDGVITGNTTGAKTLDPDSPKYEGAAIWYGGGTITIVGQPKIGTSEGDNGVFLYSEANVLTAPRKFTQIGVLNPGSNINIEGRYVPRLNGTGIPTDDQLIGYVIAEKEGSPATALESGFYRWRSEGLRVIPRTGSKEFVLAKSYDLYVASPTAASNPGNDDTHDGSEYSPYATIQKALSTVAAGTQYVNIHIETDLTIYGDITINTNMDITILPWVEAPPTGVTITRDSTHLLSPIIRTLHGSKLELREITIDGGSFENTKAPLILQEGGNVTLQGAKLVNNTTVDGTTAGVEINDPDATFTLIDGAISNNSSALGTAGVKVNAGLFKMIGGEITYNTAVPAGGTGRAAGIDIENGSAEISGGLIDDNIGDAVNLTNAAGSLSVFGNPQIGNTRTDPGVVLGSTNTIFVMGDLDPSARVNIQSKVNAVRDTTVAIKAKAGETIMIEGLPVLLLDGEGDDEHDSITGDITKRYIKPVSKEEGKAFFWKPGIFSVHEYTDVNTYILGDLLVDFESATADGTVNYVKTSKLTLIFDKLIDTDASPGHNVTAKQTLQLGEVDLAGKTGNSAAFSITGTALNQLADEGDGKDRYELIVSGNWVEGDVVVVTPARAGEAVFEPEEKEVVLHEDMRIRVRVLSVLSDLNPSPEDPDDEPENKWITRAIVIKLDKEVIGSTMNETSLGRGDVHHVYTYNGVGTEGSVSKGMMDYIGETSPGEFEYRLNISGTWEEGDTLSLEFDKDGYFFTPADGNEDDGEDETVETVLHWDNQDYVDLVSAQTDGIFEEKSTTKVTFAIMKDGAAHSMGALDLASGAIVRFSDSTGGNIEYGDIVETIPGVSGVYEATVVGDWASDDSDLITIERIYKDMYVVSPNTSAPDFDDDLHLHTDLTPELVYVSGITADGTAWTTTSTKITFRLQKDTTDSPTSMDGRSGIIPTLLKSDITLSSASSALGIDLSSATLQIVSGDTLSGDATYELSLGGTWNEGDNISFEIKKLDFRFYQGTYSFSNTTASLAVKAHTIQTPLHLDTKATITYAKETYDHGADFENDAQQSGNSGGSVIVTGTGADPKTAEGVNGSMSAATGATATAAVGYTFRGWKTSLASDATIITSSANPIAPNKNSAWEDVTYTAIFEEDASVTISYQTAKYKNAASTALGAADGTGGGTILETIAETAASNQTLAPATGVYVEITAVASPGYTFIGWQKGTGTAANESEAQTASSAAGLTATDVKTGGIFATATYTAVFEEDASVTITYAQETYSFATGNGMSEVGPSQSANAGGSVKDKAETGAKSSEVVAPVTGSPTGAKAVPAAGYSFVGWKTSVSAGNATTLTGAEISPVKNSTQGKYVTVTYTAVFEEDAPVTISYATKTYASDGVTLQGAGDGGSVVVTGESSGTVTESVAPATGNPVGASATIANAGYTIIGWETSLGTTVDATTVLTNSTLLPKKTIGGKYQTVTYTVVFKETTDVTISYATKTYASDGVTLQGTGDGGSVVVTGEAAGTVTESVGTSSGHPKGATATAEPGYSFEGWETSLGAGADLTELTENPISPAKNNGFYVGVTYTAVFKEILPLLIRFDVNDILGGSIAPDDDQYVLPSDDDDKFAEVKATANPGYHFVNWTDRGDTEISTAVTLTADMVRNENGLFHVEKYTANFIEDDNVIIEYDFKSYDFKEGDGLGNLGAEQPANPGGTVKDKSGTGMMTSESVAPVTGASAGAKAVPASGYSFVGWRTSVVDGDATILTKAVISPVKNATHKKHVAVTYTAVFEENEPDDDNEASTPTPAPGGGGGDVDTNKPEIIAGTDVSSDEGGLGKPDVIEGTGGNGNPRPSVPDDAAGGDPDAGKQVLPNDAKKDGPALVDILMLIICLSLAIASWRRHRYKLRFELGTARGEVPALTVSVLVFVIVLALFILRTDFSGQLILTDDLTPLTIVAALVSAVATVYVYPNRTKGDNYVRRQTENQQ